jgi:hypothetical protein
MIARTVLLASPLHEVMETRPENILRLIFLSARFPIGVLSACLGVSIMGMNALFIVQTSLIEKTVSGASC